MCTRVSISSLLVGCFLLFRPAQGLLAGENVGFALDNGDMNGDLVRDLSDGVYLLSHLYRGGPGPVPLAFCGSEVTPVANGDTNADSSIDLSDAVHLMRWLFVGSQGPAGACGRGLRRCSQRQSTGDSTPRQAVRKSLR